MPQRDAFLKYLLAAESDLRAYIGSLVPDRHTREDLLQEVALALWEQFESYDAARPFGAWARGIATNKILQRRERDSRFPLPFREQAILAVQAAFDRAEADTPARFEALTECLAKLAPQARQLISWRYEQGWRAAQIARESQRSVDAVYQSLSRIRTTLAECIQLRLAEGAAP